MVQLEEPLQSLVDTFDEANDELADLLEKLATGTPEERRKAFIAVQALLADLRQEFEDWLNDELQPYVDDTYTFISVTSPIKIDFLTALFTISALAMRLQRSKTVATPSEIRAFKDYPITVITKSGASRRYALDYYAGLVGHQALYTAMRENAILAAKGLGTDLVQVSGNASSIGDYCDSYRGKVFSITGAHPVFPPLSITPNGGPPFHPWCRHELEPFEFSTQAVDDLLLDKETLADLEDAG